MWIEAADEERLRRLFRMREGLPVLSVYTPVEKGLALHHGHVAALMDLLRDLRERTDGDRESELEGESARVLEFVRGVYVPRGTALAMFSSRGRRVWEVFSFQLRISPIARFNPRPYLGPMQAALDDNPRTAVALVSNKEARILTMVLAEIEGEQRMSDPVPGRQRQGGWSAFKYQRDRERHIHTHLVNVVDALVQLDKRRGFKRLVLAGTDEATAAVASILPKSLRAKNCGSVRSEMFASDDEVAKAASLMSEEAERDEERRLAAEARDRALAGGQAALGWEETLQCLREGRVHQVLIGGSEAGTPKGDEAFDLAWETGAGIEIVHHEGEEILRPYDGVGALLRY